VTTKKNSCSGATPGIQLLTFTPCLLTHHAMQSQGLSNLALNSGECDGFASVIAGKIETFLK
jgi:hypothetical protein